MPDGNRKFTVFPNLGVCGSPFNKIEVKIVNFDEKSNFQLYNFLDDRSKHGIFHYFDNYFDQMASSILRSRRYEALKKCNSRYHLKWPNVGFIFFRVDSFTKKFMTNSNFEVVDDQQK